MTALQVALAIKEAEDRHALACALRKVNVSLGHSIMLLLLCATAGDRRVLAGALAVNRFERGVHRERLLRVLQARPA